MTLRQRISLLCAIVSDPRISWRARMPALLGLAYLVSPFDLIPDSVPVLGYVDDLAVIAVATAVSYRCIPRTIIDQHRARFDRPSSAEPLRKRGRWKIRLGRLIENVLSAPNTLRFNLHYFPLKVALRLPVVVRHTVWLKSLGGEVLLRDGWRTGRIKIGFGDVGHFDRERSRTIWNVQGLVALGNGVRIVHGARVCVGPEGFLELGDGVLLNAGVAILCNLGIAIGSGTRIAWETLVMDGDFHDMVDAQENRTNADSPVRIGEKVWIGTRAIILKGSIIPDGSVVGAGSLVNRPYEDRGSLLCGSPATQRGTNVAWRG